MDLDLDRFSPVSPDAEPGMNLISSDFDLIMVNRVNERLYGKPMVELLGKKCYREFEKREEPCPHCPGRLSLVSGESHAAETEGIRDDGTWFSARVRTHPVQGPGNQPTGFIEVVEDTTEEKRAEKLARIDSDLQTSLAAADTIQKALLCCLEAALRVEGVDAGCIFSVDWAKREMKLVSQRNFSPDYVAALMESGLESAMSGELPTHLARLPGAPRASELVPIVHRNQRVAVMVVGAYVYSAIPPSLRAGLQGLGATTGNAVSRILAERSRGDAVADLEAFITIAPLATWLLDPEGRLTMWNRAAERLLGWRAGEVLGRRPPFDSLPQSEIVTGQPEATGREVTLLAKDGTPVHVRLTTAPFRDVVGNASARIVMTEDLSLQRRVAALESKSDHLTAALELACQEQNQTDKTTSLDAPGAEARLLVIDADPCRNRLAVQTLEQLGWQAVGCSSIDQAADSIAAGQMDGRTFSAALVELIAPDGSSGLELKSQLRALGMDGPVIVCSDADILGYEFHGFAAALKRPYSEELLKQTVDLTLRIPV
jgi:PAS domain S-box-containing protein